MAVRIEDHSKYFKNYLLTPAVLRALERCGLAGEGFAAEHLEQQHASNPSHAGYNTWSGGLVNSITHKVNGWKKAVYIGTNVEHGVYYELGTGAENYPGGTPKKSWVYYDEARGEFHRAYPQKPKPYLVPAVNEHAEEYKLCFKAEGFDV